MAADEIVEIRADEAAEVRAVALLLDVHHAVAAKAGRPAHALIDGDETGLSVAAQRAAGEVVEVGASQVAEERPTHRDRECCFGGRESGDSQGRSAGEVLDGADHEERRLLPIHEELGGEELRQLIGVQKVRD